MSDENPSLVPPSKLTLSKERWAREGRLPARGPARTEGERLPPGQHTVSNWPVLDLGEQPEVLKQDWRLHLIGAIERPMIWDWQQLLLQPQIGSVSDIHCVTSWSRYDNEWEGVSTRDILEAVRPHDDAKFVLLHSYDGYTTNLSLDDFAAEDALLAHSWMGKPLTTEHGAPARLIVPHLYFWKSAKWIRQIEFRVNDAPGFWEVRGYHNRGNPWDEERYS